MEEKKKIGFTCGAFDILHSGHALMLKECKDICDYLIVGLQVDPSIDRSKKNKPVQSLKERKIMLESIKWVDEIIVYETEENLYQILNNMWEMGKIDVRIIGEDWKGKKFTGHDLQIEVHYNSRNHVWSSSSLRDRIYLAETNKRKI